MAFFELPEAEGGVLDDGTPAWVQHLALKVADVETLERKRRELNEAGIEVIGPTDHKICRSIYFFDPDGHRLELTVDTTTPEMVQALRGRAGTVLEEWSRTKRAPDRDEMHA